MKCIVFDLLQNGERKYLTTKECTTFLLASKKFPNEVKTLCHLLVYTGCRNSEAVELKFDRIDFEQKVICFRTLKKRKEGIYRVVPVPELLLNMLDDVHNIRTGLKKWKCKKIKEDSPKVWNISRWTAWRRVCEVMAVGGIEGVKATPKGLRHAFGVHACESGVQLHMVSRWMGHSDMKTTTIYATASGKEERNIASRMW